MKEDEVPFMNYRVTACPKCERTLLIQWDLKEPVVLLICPCGSMGMQWERGGYKGCLLIWDEVEL